jgi:hypothetical protein
MFDEELNRTDSIKGGDGAARDDGQLRSKRSDGNESKIGATGKELVGTESRCGVMELIVFGQCGGERRMLEVPHERSRIEEVDGGYADGME